MTVRMMGLEGRGSADKRPSCMFEVLSLMLSITTNTTAQHNTSVFLYQGTMVLGKVNHRKVLRMVS